jgi:flagellum-specific peptidoglycan hydrolase FlgJ
MEAFKRQFLDSTSAAAEAAGHIFPTMAACEAGLESGFGASRLAIADKNLFGMKQHKHPIYLTHNLPTNEFLNGEWEVVNAEWITYPDLAACFADRMATLRRLAPAKGFEHYAAALAAKDAAVYVTQVSLKWSTDPKRGTKVIDIHNEYISIGA